MLEETSDNLRAKIYTRSTIVMRLSVNNTVYNCPEGLSAIETSILLADIEYALSEAQKNYSVLSDVTIDFSASQHPLPEAQVTQFIEVLSEADNVRFYGPTEDKTQEIRMAGPRFASLPLKFKIQENHIQATSTCI
ncbi:MAG: hypothetical protein K0U24_00915 [Gammaproteobacteria bacterium]|nr:hypothetical protein [Gammaproteobacteria bacterium]